MPTPDGPAWIITTASTKAPRHPYPCIPLPPAPSTSRPPLQKTDPPPRRQLPLSTPQTASPQSHQPTPRKMASLLSSPVLTPLPTPFPHIRHTPRTTQVFTQQPASSRPLPPYHVPEPRRAQVQVINILFVLINKVWFAVRTNTYKINSDKEVWRVYNILLRIYWIRWRQE